MATLKYVKRVSVPSLGDLPVKEGGGTFRPYRITRNHESAELAQNGGFTEVNEPAELELTLNASSTIDLEAINAVVGENITVALSDGQVHMLTNAWCSEGPELSKGEVSVTFRSNLSERIN